MAFDPFALLDEVATVVPSESWMLVGGLMVYAHAATAGVEHNRPTHDADIVLEAVAAADYLVAARALLSLGFTAHEAINPRAPAYRFDRGHERIDLMMDDSTSPMKFMGRQVMQVPAAGSALKNTEMFVSEAGTEIRIPTLPGALALKGAAFATASPARVRHLQDAVVLLACADVRGLTALSNTQKRHVNTIVAGLGHLEAWAVASVEVTRRALRQLRSLRPDWTPPPSLSPSRPSRP